MIGAIQVIASIQKMHIFKQSDLVDGLVDMVRRDNEHVMAHID